MGVGHEISVTKGDCGRRCALHVTPPLVVTISPPPVPLWLAPTAQQSETVGQETLSRKPMPVGKLCWTDHRPAVAVDVPTTAAAIEGVAAKAATTTTNAIDQRMVLVGDSRGRQAGVPRLAAPSFALADARCAPISPVSVPRQRATSGRGAPPSVPPPRTGGDPQGRRCFSVGPGTQSASAVFSPSRRVALQVGFVGQPDDLFRHRALVALMGRMVHRTGQVGSAFHRLSQP